ncbi:methylamine utilization protein [Prochlorococcus phage P-HM2]|uniref:Methylamine utilization protein n=1 Tax=Prochlorococcus phage P-HM2 TaxID=445696 RepID=E3SSX8_9CAUD|nr:methylamine utilization [Prochlorococcus phage P-HM2]ADO99906.1 methylamine utilization protein [Prochlorococcus phage P-HM2]
MKKTLIMNSLMSQSERTMDKVEFLAAIKLVSGEELLSMVTSVHDENGDYIIVENPIEVEEVIMPNKQAGAKVQPWMKFSREEQFVIPKEHIITIVEVTEEVAIFYHMSLRKLNSDFITDAKGKISTVDEARIKLDKIFKKGS